MNDSEYELRPDGTAVFFIPRRNGTVQKQVFTRGDIPALYQVLGHLTAHALQEKQ
jgi:hypothetical protein